MLLPPGLHQWQSETLTMERMIDLNSDIIKLGPLTLLTVDEGYSAITQNNGKQVSHPHLILTQSSHYPRIILIKRWPPCTTARLPPLGFGPTPNENATPACCA